MKYLKRIRSFKDFYSAEFTSGATTSSPYVACFFAVMGDKGVEPKDLGSYIRLEETLDQSENAKEIRRIAATFKGAAA